MRLNILLEIRTWQWPCTCQITSRTLTDFGTST